MSFSLDTIAVGSGLSFYPPPGPFNGKSGSVIGFRRGFLISAGLRDQDGRFCVLARFKAVRDAKSLLTAMKADPAMKQMYMLNDMSMKGEQSFLWTFNKPRTFDEQKFSAALEAMVNILATYAEPFQERHCEGCAKEVDHLTLANGIPNLMCDECKAKVIAEQDSMRKQYERRQPRADLALAYGLGAAVGSGLLAGFLMYWDVEPSGFHPKFFIALTVLIALAVCFAVKTGVRNVTYGACVLAAIMTLIGKVIADVLFFTKLIAADEKIDASMNLAIAVLRDLWTLKWNFNGFVAGMDVLVVLAAGFIIWKMRPNFSVAFKVVNLPGAQPQVSAAKA
jgi:hypothetical protein